ncbi:protein fem-1 homolog B isoform X2 [Topomyia yanbarensis]|uniref:protein fem-1 homolog B isoform X2 n=1 Tax=Topomyia yanbarensis TaxID=2498891 RepID=UPI00273CA313|nr:protein fem-1 homolog B isoform X2 [Topomyia yanbarensis]
MEESSLKELVPINRTVGRNFSKRSLEHHVYFACKNGFTKLLLARLKDIRCENDRKAIVEQEICEDDRQIYTPLIVAAMNGHYDVVHILLTQLQPNLEKEGCVKFDGHLIEGATALWVAAGAGHMNIIKLLVEHGADVNHHTSKLSTPVRAACFDGRLDIIRYLVDHNANINFANAYNNTCLMIASYKGHVEVVVYLLENDALPNEQANCGATALHYAAECGHVDVCSTLLDYGAVFKRNEYGMTPVICAAERTREPVVELFVNRPELLSREEKIDALELIGASFANDKDNYSLVKAFHYLTLAMELRFEDSDCILRKPILPPVPAYEHWIECQTMQDLQAIRYNHNSLHMESLAIRERILGRHCPEVAHSIVFRGAVCADNGRFDRCESLWLHAMHLRQHNAFSIQRDLLRFAQLFSQMLSINVVLRFSNVVDVLTACVAELAINQLKLANPGPKDLVEVIAEEYELNIVTVLYLITIITKLLKLNNIDITEDNLKDVYRLVYKLNQMSVRLRDDQSLLHLSVNGVTPVDDFHTDDICRFPCVDTVKLLLRCGASVAVVDAERNTPLHTLCLTLQTAIIRMTDSDVKEVIKDLTEIFIDAGVHLDAVNNDGLKASQVCVQNSVRTFIKGYETRSINLQCLAARCIALHRVTYKDVIPRKLESFVLLHCSGKF